MQFYIVLTFLAISFSAQPTESRFNSDRGGLINTVSSTFNQISSLSSKIPSLGTNNQQVTVPEPCKPAGQISPTLQLLNSTLPPQLQQFVTPKNVAMLQGIQKLGGLATAAATGNPIAILKLATFLVSSESPIIPMINFTKQIVPLLNATQLSSHIPSLNDLNLVYENTVDNVQDGIQNAFGDIQDGFHNAIQHFGKHPIPIFGENSTNTSVV